MLDQALWSSGFFLFNLTSALYLPTTEFAALAVSTTIGVIATAAIRAFSVDGRLIAAAKHGIGVRRSVDMRTLWTATGVGSVCALLVSALLLYIRPESQINWLICVLAAFIVLADLPHYVLVLMGSHVRALCVAALYSLAAVTSFGYGLLITGDSTVEIWVVISLVLGLVGLTQIRKLRLAGEAFDHRALTWRLTAESVYSAVATQLGTLIIFVVADAAVTAGIRLAYSIVFAPIFMIIQGLQPIFLRKMASSYEQGGGAERRLAIAWTTACGSGLVIVGLLAWIGAMSNEWLGQLLGPSVMFLLPVGATMLGSLGLDAALLVSRFRVHPKFPHRIRIISVSFELLVQVVGIAIAGADGLIAALTIAGCVKLTSGLVMLFLFRREDHSMLEGEKTSTR